MDMTLKEIFLSAWAKYFPGAELPLVFYFTDSGAEGGLLPAPPPGLCMIGALARAFRGETLRFAASSLGCGGARRCCGFQGEFRPGYEYFLSSGGPGGGEGRRYKKSPELVLEYMKAPAVMKAPGKYLVFKRFDLLAAGDEPEAAVFFSPPDVLSGLFTLANYDEAEPNGVISPYAPGCGSIVQYPCLERKAPRPRAVLGMFDVSARPFVPKGTLSFAAPWEKFSRMVENMNESFLGTRHWERVRDRL